LLKPSVWRQVKVATIAWPGKPSSDDRSSPRAAQQPAERTVTLLKKIRRADDLDRP